MNFFVFFHRRRVRAGVEIQGLVQAGAEKRKPEPSGEGDDGSAKPLKFSN